MSVRTRADRIWNGVIAGFAGAVLVTLGVTAVVVLGGVGKPTYSQATPDDVVKSAVLMVKNGDARLLPNLIYADSEEMRGSLKRLGVLLGHLQQLAEAIKTRFPSEIEAYRKEAEANLASSGPPALLGALRSQLSGRRDGPPDPDGDEALRDLAARIFADPYGWIANNEGRLSTVQVTDDLASVLVDGEPVAGVGLSIKQDGDKWYVALPMDMPPVSRYMPKAPEQWQMVNSLIKILDNTVTELTEDVTKGTLRNLKAIGDKAQEKTIFSAALWFGAYAGDLDQRRRVDNNVRQYRERQKVWAKERTNRTGDGASGVSDKLLGAMTRIAAKEIEPLVRSRQSPQWNEMAEREFEETIGKWMENRGLGVSLGGSLSGPEVETAVARWEEGPGRELISRKHK